MSRAVPPLLPKIPRTLQTVLMGLGLGLAASLVTTAGYLIVVFLPEWLFPLPMIPRIIFVEGQGNLGLGVLILIIALATLIPSTIGGGIIGIVLDRLVTPRLPNPRTVNFVGALIGFAAGGYVAFLFFPPGQMYRAYLLVGDVLLTGTLGALVGIAHSRILARWLKKRMHDQRDGGDSMGTSGRIIAGFIVAAITLGLILMVQPNDNWLYDSLRNPLWAAGVAVLGSVVARWMLGLWLTWRMK